MLELSWCTVCQDETPVEVLVSVPQDDGLGERVCVACSSVIFVGVLAGRVGSTAAA